MTLDVRGHMTIDDELTLLAVSEIGITRCVVTPSMVNDEQDAIKGKWVRVECDLNLKFGLWTRVSPSVYVLLHIL